MLVALDVVGGDDELLAQLELDLVLTLGVLLEPAAADLRSLQVDQGGHVAARLLAGLAHVVVHAQVILGGAVGAVQTSDVHTGFDELQELVVILASGTDGIYDLGFTHECLPILILYTRT